MISIVASIANNALKLNIKKTIILILFINTAYANDIIYKQDGDYRIISNKHLINDLPYKSNDLYQILVEIPTGSRDKWEVNHETGNLEWEFKNGKPRQVKFLGYPGNYGFIPQTLSGDNDPLDIIVLSETAQRGATLNIKVIGMIRLMDKGEEDNKVIAITIKGGFSKIDSLKEMLLKKPNVIKIIKDWFEGYKAPGKIVFMGYENRKNTIAHIEKTHERWSSINNVKTIP